MASELDGLLIIDFGLYKTRAVFVSDDGSSVKDLHFTSDGQQWTYTAMCKRENCDEWSLVVNSSQFDEAYIFSHFQKKPSLMGEYEKKMTNVFWHLVINTLSRYNNEIRYDEESGEDNFLLYILVPHIWDNLDRLAYKAAGEIVKGIYFDVSDQSKAKAHQAIVQDDPVLLPIKDDTPSFLIGIDFGDGETSASYYDIEGVLSSESGERLKRLNLGQSGTITKIYSALRKVKLFDGKESWRLMMNPKDLTGSDFQINFKKRVSEMGHVEKEVIKTYWKLVFDTIVTNNAFVEYDRQSRCRNFMLAVACPSGWSDEDMFSYRSLMINAGLPADMIMKESDAAFNKWRLKTEGKNTLVIDYGSSTIDVTIVNNNSMTSIPVPSPIGARRVEELIQDYIHNTSKTFENDCRDIEEYIIGKVDYNLETAIRLTIREAKEQYYSYEEADEMPIIFNNRQISKDLKGYLLEEYISKDEIESIILPYRKEVRTFYENIQKVFVELGFKPNYIILSGGASRMPFVKEDVLKVFNPNGTATIFHDKDDADYVVSDGLALTSIDYSVEAGHKGDKFWKIKELYDNYSEELKEYNVKEDGSLELIGEPNLLGVQKDGKWGWVNVNNTFEIPPLYDNGFVTCYNGIISQIKRNGKWGALYRRDGSVAISFEHDYLFHIYNQTYHSMNDDRFGGLIKPGNIRLTPNIYLFKNGPYGRVCEFVRLNSWGRKVEGRIDLETGKEL